VVSRELTVLSGKGGTGKTSLVASFAALATDCVIADADVDAADLHLVLRPTPVAASAFEGGSRAAIVSERCTGCGLCRELCQFGAVVRDGAGDDRQDGAGEEAPRAVFRIDPVACEGCGVCAHFCPEDAIRFGPVTTGRLLESQTPYGPLVHAELDVGEGSSGKLVSLVRTRARERAGERGLGPIIVDGPPGIGCPVIASLSGADLALVVTEPTLTGLHDLERAAALAAHFGTETLVCINKWDLNEEMAAEIADWARGQGIAVAGRVRYDRAVVEAQSQGRPLVEIRMDGAAADVRALWTTVRERLERADAGGPQTNPA
jgi:MinD superfamily P-loop ATPase